MQVVAACDVPKASVARVALAHGINANLVHKWRREQQARVEGAGSGRPAQRLQARPQQPSSAPAAPMSPMFLPVALPPASSPCGDIRVEIRRSGSVINVSWPAAAAQGCAAWLQAMIR